jgi:hypothetical protein
MAHVHDALLDLPPEKRRSMRAVLCKVLGFGNITGERPKYEPQKLIFKEKNVLRVSLGTLAEERKEWKT